MLMEAIARRRRVARFSPLSLFAAGEQGILNDLSDLSTLFADTAGTTPVTAPGQTVALALDESKGLALGPELVTNGDFSVDANWTKGTGWTISGGVATSASSGTGTLDQAISLTAGRAYRVDYTITGWVSGQAQLGFSGGTTVLGPLSGTGNGTRSFILFAATGNNLFRVFKNTSADAFSIDNISVRELSGNHLTQSTLTFRPAYQATPRRFAFDGGDDRLNSTYAPRVAGSYAVRFNGSAASRVAIGSQGATDGRAFLGLAAEGSIAAGIGTESTATIKGATDVRNTWVTGTVTWNGTTVRLYQDGVEVYSGAQSGAVNTTIPIDLGALNNNSSRAAFWAGSIGAAVAIDRVLTPAEIMNLHNFWRTIA